MSNAELMTVFSDQCRYLDAVTGRKQQGMYLRCRWQDYPYSPAPPGMARQFHHMFLADEYDLACGLAVLRLVRQIPARAHMVEGCDYVYQIDLRSGVATRQVGLASTIAGRDLGEVWGIVSPAPQTTAVGVVLACEEDGRNHRLPQEIYAVTCSWVDAVSGLVYEALLWPVDTAKGDFSAVVGQYFFFHPVNRVWVCIRQQQCAVSAPVVGGYVAPIADTPEIVGDFMAAVQQRVKRGS